jgi:hypothetical protein
MGATTHRVQHDEPEDDPREFIADCGFGIADSIRNPPLDKLGAP